MAMLSSEATMVMVHFDPSCFYYTKSFITRRGTESSLNWNSSGIRPPETVMSTGGLITDSVRPYAPHWSL